MNPFEAVKEFHRVFGLPMGEKVTAFLNVPLQQRQLRLNLIEEEYKELCDAESANDVVEIADALADIIVIACGTAVVYGIDLEKVFEEVHRSNMAKCVNGCVIRRHDGKVMKPKDWQPPKIATVLGLPEQ
jgi:predicted HAD superfamily Cof-like phosphohydrolase